MQCHCRHHLLLMPRCGRQTRMLLLLVVPARQSCRLCHAAGLASRLRRGRTQAAHMSLCVPVVDATGKSAAQTATHHCAMSHPPVDAASSAASSLFSRRTSCTASDDCLVG
jgi:hypothetical protein